MLLSDLQQSPFDLTQGTLVKVKIQATNAFGTSVISEANTVGALIETVPWTPTVAPSRGANTGETQIELVLTPLTGVNTGGSTITSYVVLWNAGSGTTLTPLLGVSTPNTATTVLINSGISSG